MDKEKQRCIYLGGTANSIFYPVDLADCYNDIPRSAEYMLKKRRMCEQNANVHNDNNNKNRQQ